MGYLLVHEFFGFRYWRLASYESLRPHFIIKIVDLKAIQHQVRETWEKKRALLCRYRSADQTTQTDISPAKCRAFLLAEQRGEHFK